MSARAIGEDTDSSPSLMSASSSPTSWYTTLLPPSWSSSSMVEPNTTRPLALNLVTSMTSAFDRRFSMSLMRPSMKLCCSRAAWYSAFSLKSPWARASAIALMTFGRASLLSCFNSARNRSAPRRVMGVRFTMPAALCAEVREFVSPRQHFLVQILQPTHFDVAQVIERVASRPRSGHRRVVGYLSRDRLAANRTRLAHRLLAFGGIDDQGHLVVFYHIDDVRATLPHLVDPPARHSGLFQHQGSAAGGGNLEAARDQHLRQHHRGGLVAVAHADEAEAMRRQDHPGSRLRLGVGLAKGVSRTHHLAGGFHLRTEDGIGLGKFDERKHGLLDGEVRGNAFRSALLHGQRLARHDARCNLGQGNPGGLGNEGDGTRRPRIDLQDVDHAALDGELNVHQ